MMESNETQMLNVAAAERTLLRTALQDCVTILEEFRQRDFASKSGRTLRWDGTHPPAIALKNAKQLLSPRPDLRPLKQKETA